MYLQSHQAQASRFTSLSGPRCVIAERFKPRPMSRGFFLGWWLVYRSPNEVVTIHKTGMKAGMKMKCKQKNLVSMRVATHNFLFSS